MVNCLEIGVPLEVEKTKRAEIKITARGRINASFDPMTDGSTNFEIKVKFMHLRVSFNGRTAVSKTANRGSIPFTRAK